MKQNKVKELEKFNPKELFSKFIDLHAYKSNGMYVESDNIREYIKTEYGLEVFQENGLTRVFGQIYSGGIYYSIMLSFDSRSWLDKAKSLLNLI